MTPSSVVRYSWSCSNVKWLPAKFCHIRWSIPGRPGTAAAPRPGLRRHYETSLSRRVEAWPGRGPRGTSNPPVPAAPSSRPPPAGPPSTPAPPPASRCRSPVAYSARTVRHPSAPSGTKIATALLTPRTSCSGAAGARWPSHAGAHGWGAAAKAPKGLYGGGGSGRFTLTQGAAPRRH